MFKRLVLVLSIFGLLLAACTSTTSSTATTTTELLSSPVATNEAQVSISNFAFDPPTLTIPKGTTVIWSNKDSVAHNIVENNNLFSSPTLATGDQFRYTFDTAGTFNYKCTFHSNMNGQIIVQ